MLRPEDSTPHLRVGIGGSGTIFVEIIFKPFIGNINITNKNIFEFLLDGGSWA